MRILWPCAAGIVQGKATIAALERLDAFVRLRVAFPANANVQNVTIGASVALNGTCLTVTAQSGYELCFDVIEETLRVTNLGALREGSAVNFERAAKMGDEIGGHGVSGHVHTTASVVEIKHTADNCRVTLRPLDGSWMKYVLPKGYIALDGCSLTVGEVTGDSFCVYLIPETLQVTLFGTAVVGQAVNLEVDAQTQAIVDTVERFLKQNPSVLQAGSS